MDDTKRITILKIVVSLSFFVGILFANRLWFADRLYPLDPAITAFLLVPRWVDYLLTPVLLCCLACIASVKNAKNYILAALVLIVFLVFEDQGRLFPSFYEYTLLLIVLLVYFWVPGHDDEKSAGPLINICRTIIIFVYIWGGAQKINPFFENQFSLVALSITNALPALRGSLAHWGAILAPFIEMEIGLGLLFKKTRSAALTEVLLMHAALFFLIGPWRSVWNEGAWAWNLASGFIVFTLFSQADGVGAKEILFGRGVVRNESAALAYLRTGIIILVGMLPMLSFVNMWDSALSFNIYSGNVAHAEIYVSSTIVPRLPEPFQKYIEPVGAASNSPYFIDVNRWSEEELHAEPYPEPRVFKNIARSFCSYAQTSSDVEISIHDKLRFLEKINPLNQTVNYNCSNL